MSDEKKKPITVQKRLAHDPKMQALRELYGDDEKPVALDQDELQRLVDSIEDSD